MLTVVDDEVSPRRSRTGACAHRTDQNPGSLILSRFALALVLWCVSSSLRRVAMSSVERKVTTGW